MRRPLIPDGADVGLRAVGTSLAAVSVAFAVHMFMYGDGKVRVLGMEHLAIFAQPRGAAPRAPAPPDPAPQNDALDMAATGSFVEPAPEPPPPSRPELVAARPGRAWLRIDGKIIAAERGQEIARLGRIGGVVERDGGWVVLDDKGAQILALRPGANAVRLFRKGLIFD